MATNLEFKAQCQSLESFYPRLADLKATHHETVRQIDTYFYMTVDKCRSESEAYEPRLKLREVDGMTEAWLIYYERPNHDDVPLQSVPTLQN